jgi:hypothetical protein
MREPHYTVKFSVPYTVFEFISEGPKGEIPKIISFQPTENPKVVNLGFGDKIGETDDFDDEVTTDNQDTWRVLATVAASVRIFSEHNPRLMIFASGSTPSRTRLYRIGISKYFDDISKEFLIFGYLDEEWQKFEKNQPYTGFLAIKKFISK